MAHIQFTLIHQLFDIVVQVSQAQQVADRGTGTTDRFRHLLVGHIEFINQALQRAGLFQRVEVFTLDIFDQ